MGCSVSPANEPDEAPPWSSLRSLQRPQVYKCRSALSQPHSPSSSVHRFTMSQYGKTTIQRGGEDFAAQTRARLETIKTHLETAPRSGKLRGKTCVITGAGSLKGIGSVRSSGFASHAPHLFAGELPRYGSLMKVGATCVLLPTVDPYFWSPIQARHTCTFWIS